MKTLILLISLCILLNANTITKEEKNEFKELLKKKEIPPEYDISLAEDRDIYDVDGVKYTRAELNSERIHLKKMHYNEKIKKLWFGDTFINGICNDFSYSFGNKTYLYKYNAKIFLKMNPKLPNGFMPKYSSIKINKNGLFYQNRLDKSWKKIPCEIIIKRKVIKITPNLFQIKMHENFCNQGKCHKIKQDYYYFNNIEIGKGEIKKHKLIQTNRRFSL